jgi:hypothetical protein
MTAQRRALQLPAGGNGNGNGDYIRTTTKLRRNQGRANAPDDSAA